MSSISGDLTAAHEALDVAAYLTGDMPPIRGLALTGMIDQIDSALFYLENARAKAIIELRTLEGAEFAGVLR